MKNPALRPQLLNLAILLALAACTPLPASPSPTADRTPEASREPAATATPTRLPALALDASVLRGQIIQVWHAFSDGAEQVFNEQVNAFNSGNEWGIVVLATGYGDHTSLLEAVDASLADGSFPDLAAALPEQALLWDAAGSLVDLAAYAADPEWGLPADLVAAIPVVFWQQDEIDGRRLGIPALRSGRFLYYNQTWGRELGFSQPPATPQEFRSQACAANAAYRRDENLQNDGYGGWIVDSDWQTAYAWLLAFGGGAVDGGTYALRNDPNLEALQYLKGLLDENCAWISTELVPYESFARRSALFISGDLAALNQAQEAMTRLGNADEWTLLPYPGEDGQVTIVYGSSYSVLKTTPERQLAAWLFASWLLTPENQAAWVRATGMLPLFDDLADMAISPQWAAAAANLDTAAGVPQLASWRKVRYLLEDGMRVMVQRNLAPDQLAGLLDEIDALAKELGTP